MTPRGALIARTDIEDVKQLAANNAATWAGKDLQVIARNITKPSSESTGSRFEGWVGLGWRGGLFPGSEDLMLDLPHSHPARAC